MPKELEPRIYESYDHDTFDRDTGKVKRMTVVSYRLGELGPFREEFEVGTLTEYELRERMRRRAESLKPFT